MDQIACKAWEEGSSGDVIRHPAKDIALMSDHGLLYWVYEWYLAFMV